MINTPLPNDKGVLFFDMRSLTKTADNCRSISETAAISLSRSLFLVSTGNHDQQDDQYDEKCYDQDR